MPHYLCGTCIKRIARNYGTESLARLLDQIAEGEVILTHWPHNCDNREDPGHPKPARYILEELPDKARG